MGLDFLIGVGEDAAARRVGTMADLVGDPRRNLGTFSTTRVSAHGARVHERMLAYNAVNRAEYPCVDTFESTCLGFLADRWNLGLPARCAVQGMATFGSSEAAHLAATALHWSARPLMSAGAVPNLVMAANAHVCWRQLCRYTGIEARITAVDPRTHTASPSALSAACDENTIGVVATVGAPYTGLADPVHDIATMLDGRRTRRGEDIGIHVDAASGGFTLPFLAPGIEWDFRLPRVRSINVSGHKYGLVPPTLGWILWRDASALPVEMFCDSDYLTGHTRTLGLGYSRSAANIAHQYFNIASLGVNGYTRVLSGCATVARTLLDLLTQDPELTALSAPEQLPVVVVTGRQDRIEAVAGSLHTRGWQVPTYRVPWSQGWALRMVCRPDLTPELGDQLTNDVRNALRTPSTHRDAGLVPAGSGGTL